MATVPEHDAELRVLLVDDDPDDHVLTGGILAEIPGGKYTLDWVSDYDAGLEKMCRGDYDVVLLDYRLGARTGLDLLAEVRIHNRDVPVIFLTGLSDTEIDLAAMKRGADNYLEKGRLDPIILERAIRYAIQQRQIEAELEKRVRERTEELDKAIQSLKAADRRKDEFLATLAHELRNPLAPIRNALEIMRLSDGRPDAIVAARKMMERQVGQLIRLIDDLLDISRITRNKLKLMVERLPITDVIDSAIEQSRPLLDKASLTVAKDFAKDEIWLMGDRVRLSQIFTNILNNAAKYSEPGGEVAIKIHRDAANVFVEIRDHGVGIVPEQLEEIFEPFSQVDRTHDRSQGGLGIGLNLVRNLIGLHGGRVTAESEGLGHGSCFTVTLPLLIA